jgi:hypothetical protein
MHPDYYYDTLSRGRAELLRQAENERMARMAIFKQKVNWKFHRKVANWLGTHFVNWGKKLQQFGTPA